MIGKKKAMSPLLHMRWRLLSDIVCLAMLSVGFRWRNGSFVPFRGPDLPFPQAILSSLFTIVWWLFAVRAAAALARILLGHDQRSRQTRLLADLVSGCIYLAGGLVVLDLVLRLPIGGLLATSGVVAIVVGLALQNTLSDVFSGIAVGVEQPFRVGDRIRLGAEVEGRVVQVNWRSIRLQTDSDDLAIIPNSTVAKAQIVNRSTEGTAYIDIAVPTTLEPDRAIELLGWAALLAPEVRADSVPHIHLLRLGEHKHTFAITFKVDDVCLIPEAKSNLLRQVHRQLHAGQPLLGETSIFATLDREQIDHLEQRLSLRHLQAGERLFSEGDIEAVFYLMADGVIELSRVDPDEEVRLGRIGRGDYIGEIGLLTGAPRIVSATALTRATVLCLSRDAIEPLLTSQPEMAEIFERSIRKACARFRRSPAALSAEPVSAGSDLLKRIRHFFAGYKAA